LLALHHGGTIFLLCKRVYFTPTHLSIIFFACDPDLKRSTSQGPQPPREDEQAEPRNVPTWDTRLSYLAALNFSNITRPRQSKASFEIVCKGTTFFAYVQIFLHKNLIFRELQSRGGKKKLLSKIGYYGTKIGFIYANKKSQLSSI
jgi:hypothetical protein